MHFSKPGFAATVVTDARVLSGQTTTVNGHLRPEFYELEEYEVTAEVFTEQTEEILIERQKSSAMMEALGSDFLARVGAGNAAESIAKVSGATIVDGKSAVVRGLNDRYITTTLNGASLPSADPYRQSASLDLFPSQVIDRVVVLKTFSPDQPGAFTGGGIDMVTRSFPEKPFLSLSLGGAYNTQARVTKELGVTEFAPRHETAPLNQNFSIAGGGSTNVFGGVLGYFAGGSYKHDYTLYEDGISRRYQQGTQLKNSYQDARALSIVNWSGMVNLAYKPFENHELGFTFFYNQNGTDDTRVQNQGFEQSDTSATFRKFNLYYTERNLNTYQMKGEHHFPELGGLQFNWLTALTETTQDEPDARFFNDFSRGGGFTTGNPAPSPSDPTRYFRHLEENNQNVKLDWALPFRNGTDEEGAVKAGLFGSDSQRAFFDRAFYYKGGAGYGDAPNLYINAVNLGANPTTNAAGRINFHWGEYAQVFDSLYEGKREIQAGYLMAELPIAEKLRLVGGMRFETADLGVHSESYVPSSVTSQFMNESTIAQSDLLPGLGLIYSIQSNMNVRVNYSQTLARPSFRELAAYYAYDPVIDEFVEGNPRLQMTAIDNYDVRWEWFPRPGFWASVSPFYKNLKNAVERGDRTTVGDVITYFNRDEAKLYGIELETRRSLDLLGATLSPFSLGGNASLVQSEVELTEDELGRKRGFFPEASSTRPLYDQSPYLVNLDLCYNNPRSGTTATVIYNIAAPRIALAKLNTEDVYEQSAPALDFVFSQRIGRHTTLKFAAKNLLDPSVERTYGKDGTLLYSAYTRGRTFGLTLNYEF